MSTNIISYNKTTKEPDIFTRIVGNKLYEINDHLGNVRATVSDRRLGENADLRSSVMYYPFGMPIANRTQSLNYRFGFNGKENDNEVNGNGRFQDYGFRSYMTDIARFASVDPISRFFPWNSCYAFAENDVIRAIDREGLYKYPKNKQKQYSTEFPILTAYLAENVAFDIQNSPTIKNGFKTYSNAPDEYGKNMNDDDIKIATKWGEGPNIEIVDAPNGEKKARGYYNSKTNTIQINTLMAKQLENATPEDRQSALYSIFVTLTHETVHYGDYLDGIRLDNDVAPGWGGEPGNAFMYDVFYSKSIDAGGGEMVRQMQNNFDHEKIPVAKVMMEMNILDGHKELIPGVPSEKSITNAKKFKFIETKTKK